MHFVTQPYSVHFSPEFSAFPRASASHCGGLDWDGDTDTLRTPLIVFSDLLNAIPLQAANS